MVGVGGKGRSLYTESISIKRCNLIENNEIPNSNDSFVFYKFELFEFGYILICLVSKICQCFVCRIRSDRE